MGHGIAYAAIAAGYSVQLFDVSQGVLERAGWSIRGIAEKAVQRGDLTADACREMLARLSASTSLADTVQHAELIIEAVPERIEVKLTTFEALQNNAPATAVLATNTSALSITEMASVLDDPSRLAGMHFFNPVHRMKLVEIIRALETGDQTIAAIEEVARRMGKETVLVRESPGFITSRLNALIGNEAFYMLQEGVGTARDIDKAVKLGLNHPMGPFELVDLVGLDTRLAILQYLHRTLGEKFRPCPLLEQHVKAGRLGRKAGRGVYEY
jgi:3-hydroxybutyryl-CoA dehydrogenase